MFEKKTHACAFPFECETDRLVLKVANPEMLREVLEFQLRNKLLFEKYEPTRPDNFYTLEYQSAMLKCEFQLALKMSTIRYYVYLKEDSSPIIGTVCLHDILRFSYSCAELGYKFDEAFHHKGYATEAIVKVLTIAFSDLKLHRIFARVRPDNLDSIRLLHALSFAEEGIEREGILIQGIWSDHIRFALIAPENGCVVGLDV